MKLGRAAFGNIACNGGVQDRGLGLTVAGKIALNHWNKGGVGLNGKHIRRPCRAGRKRGDIADTSAKLQHAQALQDAAINSARFIFFIGAIAQFSDDLIGGQSCGQP